MYRDVRLLCRAVGLEVSPPAYLLLQTLSGTALFGLGLLVRRDWDRPRLYRWLFGLVCCWMTVCGTATESCTYLLAAPALAWGLVEPRRGRSGWLAAGLMTGSAVLLLACQVSAWWPGGNRFHALGPHPLAGVLLTAGLLLPELPALFRRGELTPRRSHLVS